nr:hypothetical protein [Desulfobulbaceae bacterium]
MQQILSAQAKEGMVLAKDVMTPESRVLCGKGTVLSTTLLDRLEKMDIVHVTVEGHPVELPGEKTLKQELQAVEERFSDVTQIAPLMYIKQRIMKKLVESRG